MKKPDSKYYSVEWYNPWDYRWDKLSSTTSKRKAIAAYKYFSKMSTEMRFRLVVHITTIVSS